MMIYDKISTKHVPKRRAMMANQYNHDDDNKRDDRDDRNQEDNPWQNNQQNNNDEDPLNQFFTNMNSDDNNNDNGFNQLPVPPNYAKITNDQGDLRIAKVGFSWTTLWFGPLPAAFRGDWYNFILMIVLDLDYVLVAMFFKLNWMLQFPWPSIIYSAFYNMMYFRHLFNRGYRPADERSRKLLAAAHYLPKSMR